MVRMTTIWKTALPVGNMAKKIFVSNALCANLELIVIVLFGMKIKPGCNTGDVIIFFEFSIYNLF